MPVWGHACECECERAVYDECGGIDVDAGCVVDGDAKGGRTVSGHAHADDGGVRMRTRWGTWQAR